MATYTPPLNTDDDGPGPPPSSPCPPSSPLCVTPSAPSTYAASTSASAIFTSTSAKHKQSALDASQSLSLKKACPAASDVQRSCTEWDQGDPSYIHFFFVFFGSTIYNAGLERSPRDRVQTKVAKYYDHSSLIPSSPSFEATLGEAGMPLMSLLRAGEESLWAYPQIAS
jgi:hypothetical protein